ncbi:hypothetical protein FBU30_000143, partial [Linnemannia zychae]
MATTESHDGSSPKRQDEFEITPSPTGSPLRNLDWTPPKGPMKKSQFIRRSPIRLSPGISPSRTTPSRSHTYRGWFPLPGSRASSNSPGTSRASSSSPSKHQLIQEPPQAPRPRRQRLIIEESSNDEGGNDADRFWGSKQSVSPTSVPFSNDKVTHTPTSISDADILKRDGNSVTKNELIMVAKIFKMLQAAPEAVQ